MPARTTRKTKLLELEDLALEVSLKKMKLYLKDQMELIVARHRHNQSVMQQQMHQNQAHY